MSSACRWVPVFSKMLERWVLAVASEMPRRLAAVVRPSPFNISAAKPRLCGGQAEAAAQIDLPPASGDIGVAHRDNCDGVPDTDPRNVREPGLGAKRRHRHVEG